NEAGVDEHVAMVRVGVANPHVRPHRLNFAMVEERGTDAENGVAIADDSAVGEVNGAAKIERVTRALDVYVTHDIFRTGDEQAFRLTVGVIADRKVVELDAGGVINRKRAAPVRPRLGRVESAVVRIAYLHFFAVFAANGEVGLIAKEDDLLVRAVFDKDRHALRRVIGNEVDRTLDGIEVAAAVGCHGHARRAGARSSSPGAEGPALVGCEAIERTARGDEHAGVDLHDVLVVVVQNVVVRVDRGYIAVDDDGIEMKIGQTTDGRELVVVQIGRCNTNRRSGGFGRGRNTGIEWNSRHRSGDTMRRIGAGGNAEVQRIYQLMARNIVNTHLPGFANSWRSGEGEHQMCVGIDAAGLFGREVRNGLCLSM